MTHTADTLRKAFGRPAWRDIVEALFEASGLSLVVMDAPVDRIVHEGIRCTYCDATYDGRSEVGGSCFDDPPAVSSTEQTYAVCRGGLPSYIAPVVVGGVHRCNIVLGGFVTSTRERKRLFERLLGRGMAESQARKAVREVPVIAKHEVEALLRMSVASATQMLESEYLSHDGGERLHGLEQLVSAAREFSEHPLLGPGLIDAVLSGAMRMVAADAGAMTLVRGETGLHDVIATRGREPRYALGQVLRTDEDILGQVFSTGRGLLVSGNRDVEGVPTRREMVSAAFVPLRVKDRLIGLLDIELSGVERHLTVEDLRMLEEYADMAAAAIESGRDRKQADRALRELEQQGEFVKALGSADDVTAVADAAALALASSFGSPLVGVVVTGWGRDEAVVVPGEDLHREDVENILGEASGRDVKRSAFHELRLLGDGRVSPAGEADEPCDWVTLSTELIVRGTVFGYAFVAAREAGAFDRDDRRMLTGFADHTAAAMERVATLERLRDDLAKTITALSATLDAGEHAERGHSDRVMDYAVAIGEELGASAEEIETLRFAGLLHDVGKVGLSEEILLKPSRLNEAETQLVRMHAEIGASVVEQIEFLNSITPVILHHHERWDGNGYPMGIAGEEIPLLARILSVADAFDAMSSTRPYRPRLSYAQAKTELMKASGTQFDPAVVEAFLEAMDRRALAGASGLFAERMSPGPHLPA